MARKELQLTEIDIHLAAAIATFVLGFFVFFPGGFFSPIDHLLHTTNMKDFITWGAALEEDFLDGFTANRTFQVSGGIIVDGKEIHLALVFGEVIHFLYCV